MKVAVLVGSVALLAIANALTTRRLWASAMFERRQKVAQTVMIWLLPGTFVVTRMLLGGAPARDDDPTALRPDGDRVDDAGTYHHHGEDFR